MTTTEDEFQVLVGVFASRGNKVLEIEIIPSSHGAPFLQDGLSIGVTKKALASALVVARRLFFTRLLPMSEDDLYADVIKREPETTSASNHIITEIMLLFDCEHLTACNWRKRWLQAAIMHCERNFLDEMFNKELSLLQTYQCSPLHRHTKSPTLWSHRLWVLNAMVGLQKPAPPALGKLGRAELDIVLRAGELHPKNYYAFTYMRNLHLFLVDVAKAHGTPVPSSIAEAMLEPTLNWCLSNPRDISGWMFEKYLLEYCPDLSTRAGIVRRVLRFALDVRWEGESLWTFIDQTTKRFDLEQIVEEALKRAPAQMESDSPQDRQKPWQKRLDRARAYWTMPGGPEHSQQPV